MLKGAPTEPVSADSGLTGTELRLRAEDAEDLAVISACVQDALVAVRDLAYDRDARTFVLVTNRFRWEGCGSAAGDGATFERTLCGIAFDMVEAVAYRGFQRGEEDRILSLLAIQPVAGQPAGADLAGISSANTMPNAAIIDIEFAGGVTIRLSTSAIRVRARDFGEPWPTAWRPAHSLDEPALDQPE